MLAERKDKKKWSQDPRNTFWSKDKTKFGYRMLQRMGWEEGRGLGVREDGREEHVKIQRKKDNSGLGRMKSRDDEWIEHQDAFDQILADLNAKQAPSIPEHSESKSLVENAAQSGRHMYKRYLQSKDLSAVTSEDLDCVLGRKRSRQSSPEVKQEEESTSDGGITVVTSHQSIQEYFATKSRRHNRRQERDIQKEHSLAVSDNSYCDQHMKEKMRTKCSRRRGDGELNESGRQLGSVRSNLTCLEGR